MELHLVLAVDLVELAAVVVAEPVVAMRVVDFAFGSDAALLQGNSES